MDGGGNGSKANVDEQQAQCSKPLSKFRLILSLYGDRSNELEMFDTITRVSSRNEFNRCHSFGGDSTSL